MLLYSFFTMIVVLINSENTNFSNKGVSKIMSPVEITSNNENEGRYKDSLIKCGNNEDCPYRYFCDQDAWLCKRENIFPLKTFDYFAIICLSFIAILTTAAGIGGGEIIVPALKILFQYAQSEASTLSHCCIVMAGITRFIINYKRKHPYCNAVPIDYKAAMLLMPSIFFGLSLGVMVYKIP